MSTTDLILEALEERRGEFVSGEELAKRIGVSRSAVAKAISGLKAEGLEIESVTGVGHRLTGDDFTAQGVRKYLKSDVFDVRVYPALTSTNDEARRLALGGADEFTVVVAREQSKGRGRIGRKYFSQKGAGVYFSVILRPEVRKVPFITSLAAVAVMEGIERAGGKRTFVKWVNDVFADGKKCCGILTEAISDLEGGGVEFAVLGIGVNVRAPKGGYPEEIRDIATSCLDGVPDAHNKVIAAILDRIYDLYADFDKDDVVKRYRERSFLQGRKVRVAGAFGERDALVTGIDDDCRLLVRYEDGKEAALSSGEVKISW